MAIRDVTYELQRRSTSFKWPNEDKTLDAFFGRAKKSSQVLPILTSLLEHCEVLPLGLCIGCRYQASSDENEQHVV